MSKIALTPSATGTGVFTIASPATNTDRTLTLPDEAGTVLINGTTSNVGIGTSLPVTLVEAWADTPEITITSNNSLSTSGGSENISSVGFRGQQNNLYRTTARIQARQNGTWSTVTAAYAPTALEFYTQSIGTGDGMASPHMTIDASGNVGIGTSSPILGKLHVLASGTSNASMENVAHFSKNSTSRAGLQIKANATVVDVGIQAQAGAGNIALTLSSLLNGNNIERMRIDSSGNLLVGATAFSGGVQCLQVESNGKLDIGTDTTAGSYRIQFFNPNGFVGSIATNGSSVQFNTSSDYRLKTDAQPMTGASDRVLALKPVNFAWIVNGSRVDGFLAHEAQEIVPEAVTGTKDAMRDEEYEVTAAVYEDIIIAAVLDEEGNELEAERTEQRLVTEAVMGTRSVPDMQGIDQSKLVPLLTAALQEALNKIDAMEIRLAALEAV